MINIDQSASARRRGPVMTSALRSLIWARGPCDFGDGFVAVLLPVHLTVLGFSPLEIGILYQGLLRLTDMSPFTHPD